MKIGVVCTSDQRVASLQKLLRDHHLVRLSAEDAACGEPLAGLEGLLIDLRQPGIAAQPASLEAALRPLGFQPAAEEDHPPCVLRYDELGRLQLQCGRQAAAKLRAAKGRPPGGTSTLVFQSAQSAPSTQSPRPAEPLVAGIAAAPCQG